MLEYGIELSKRGYHLEPGVRRLTVVGSDREVAAFTLTEAGSLDIVARNEQDEPRWVDVKPIDGSYEQSKLRRKEIQLDRILGRV